MEKSVQMHLIADDNFFIFLKQFLGSKPLYVALAQRKEDRKAHLASQNMQRISGMRMQQMGQVFLSGLIFLTKVFQR